jgi:hypothetical protein
MSVFENKSAPDPGPDFIKQLREQVPNIFLVLFRSKNQNVVVYEAQLNADASGFDEKNPIKCGWLDVDPEYRQPKRQQNQMGDYAELNYLEKKIGLYDFQVTVKNSKNLVMTLNAYPQVPMVIKFVSPSDIKCLTKYKDENYYISHLMIHASENILDLMNNIKQIQVHGVHLGTKQPVSFDLDL